MKGRDPAFLAEVRKRPCVFCRWDGVPQRAPTEVEHLETRGHGGVDRGNTVPGCGYHRELRHTTLGIQSFGRRYPEMWAEATRLAREIP